MRNGSVRMVAGMAVRVAIVTVLFALLSFAVGLFLGIVGVVALHSFHAFNLR